MTKRSRMDKVAEMLPTIEYSSEEELLSDLEALVEAGKLRKVGINAYGEQIYQLVDEDLN